MRIPYAFQGAIFAPVLLVLIFILKSFCPESAAGSCFADYFAVPIFIPLITIYKIFGEEATGIGNEFAFILLYWALIGFALGIIIDLYRRPSRYLPSQDRPLSQT